MAHHELIVDSSRTIFGIDPTQIQPDTTIRMIGDNITLNFLFGAPEGTRIVDEGRDNTITFGRTDGITVVDHGRGLTLGFGAAVHDVTIEDFHHDHTGRFSVLSNQATLAPPMHGAILVSALQAGISNIRFDGFHRDGDLAARLFSA